MRWLEGIVFWAFMVAGLATFGVRLVLWLGKTLGRWVLGNLTT